MKSPKRVGADAGFAARFAVGCSLPGTTQHPRCDGFMARYITVFVVLVSVVLVYLVWTALPTPVPKKLSVEFIGMTNITTGQASLQVTWTTNTTTGQTLPIVVSGIGATGRCALFWVTNITAHYTWFQTTSVEQKAETGWQECIPSRDSWCGVGGSGWPPRFGRVQAIGWPPGLPTNASWRLQVRYGPDPPPWAISVNTKFHRVIFHSRDDEGSPVASSVVQP